MSKETTKTNQAPQTARKNIKNTSRQPQNVTQEDAEANLTRQEPSESSPQDFASIAEFERLGENVDLNLYALSKRVDELTEYSLKTRTNSVLSSHSISLLNNQFEKHIAEKVAQKQSLLAIESELSERHQSCEALVREKTRLAERLTYMNHYLDNILQNMRSVADQNVSLRQQNKQYKLELDAATQVIANFGAIIKVLNVKAAQKQLPQDVIAAIKTYMPEIAAVKQAKQQYDTPLALESEGE